MSPPSTSEKKLDSGCTVLANHRRVIVTLNDNGKGWTTLSSAVLNGGHLQVTTPARASPQRSTTTRSNDMHVLNAKVPVDYDGVHPDPEILLKRFANDDKLDPKRTVGLLTAASMQTLRMASRQADGVVVDVIVTAGITNARRAGADADCFLFGDEDEKNNDRSNNNISSPFPPGTINTVVVTNASLTPGALVEAYSIAVEAKCAACSDLGVTCTSSMLLAQGTGTDCTVIVAPSCNHQCQYNTTAAQQQQVDQQRTVKYAGKHTIFAELVGQAVEEATKEAILTNVYHLYGNRASYAMHQLIRRATHILRGARPCIPPRPMMPVPWAPPSVVVMGITSVLFAFMVPIAHTTRVLIAVVSWDRYLGEPPLCIHPVVLIGQLISASLSYTPDSVFVRPTLGLCCGLLLLGSMLALSLATTRIILVSARTLSDLAVKEASLNWLFGQDAVRFVCAFAAFVLEVVLVKSACSLQLLCTIALQMAKFLERRQLCEARDQLSWLCSRDPSNLRSEELAGATLESLAENLSDGFVAPLFWYTICGPLGALGYRVVNTLDSRIGYRGKYEWFGKPSALLDDFLNLVPARLTAVLLVVAAVFIPRCDAKRGWRVACQDSSQCASPCAGWPMGSMAGLLGVRLEKQGQYNLGGCEGFAPPGIGSIRTGHRVAALAGGLAAVAALILCSCFRPRPIVS